MGRAAEGSERRFSVFVWRRGWRYGLVWDGNTSRFSGKRNVMIDGISIWIICCYAANTRPDLVVTMRGRGGENQHSKIRIETVYVYITEDFSRC